MLSDKVLDNGRIGQRRNVTHFVCLISRYFTQNAAHNLARTRFWQASADLLKYIICKCKIEIILPHNLIVYLYDVRQCIGGDFLPDNSSKFSFRFAIWGKTVFQDHVSVNSFTFDIVWVADDGRLCYRRVLTLWKTRWYQVTFI